jgi:hypothetical protein
MYQLAWSLVPDPSNVGHLDLRACFDAMYPGPVMRGSTSHCRWMAESYAWPWEERTQTGPPLGFIRPSCHANGRPCNEIVLLCGVVQAWCSSGPGVWVSGIILIGKSACSSAASRRPEIYNLESGELVECTTVGCGVVDH